jgi:transporter family-2 protein
MSKTEHVHADATIGTDMTSAQPYAAALAVSILAGMIVPLQAGANGQLGRLLGHPLWAVMVSLLVSAALVAVALAALRAPAPALGPAADGPAWIWIGGLVGALYITGAVLLAPKLGASTFLVATIFGQLVTALAIDQFGLVGFAVRPLGPGRLTGMALVLAGVIAIHVSTPRPAA